MELFELLGIIALQGRDEFNRDLDSVSNKTEKFANKLKNGLGKAAKIGAKAVTASLAVAGAAITAITKNAVENYAEYEQLVGGVETLFKDSADTVMQYAENAYKTAGLSANDYMETVTSFSASLLQSLGGDTAKAAEMADLAITDMADNANKMGTDMASIQNAYQGFAKQNYTMLDNLKLGYGGTQEEMQRLIDDANALNAAQGKLTNYSIDSYADVVSAIHDVQTEMGITGTTAAEAASTITGSIASMKGSWQNLLTAMSSEDLPVDEYVSAFVDSVSTVADNLLPRIGIALDGVVQLVNQLAPQIVAAVPELVSTLLTVVVNAATSLVGAIAAELPGIVSALVACAPSIISAFVSIFDALITALPTLFDALASALPTLIPLLIDGLINMVVELCNDFAQIIQPLIAYLPDIIITFVEALTSNLPAVIDGCITLVMGIVQAVPQIIQELVDAIPTIISMIVTALLENLPAIIAGLIQVVLGVRQALPQIFMSLIKSVPNIMSGIWQGVKNVFSGVGDFFGGIFGDAWESVKGAFSTVEDFFAGMWEGIKGAFGSVTDWFKNIFSDAWNAVKNVFSSGGEIFSGIKEGIADTFINVVNAIIKGINTVVAVPFNAINAVLNKVRSIEILDYQPFADLWSQNPLAVPQIPLLETGGVLKKGQVGLLEGSGAEAVVPLERNTGWINGIAERLNALQGNTPADNSAVLAKLDAILDAILSIGNLREAIDGAALKINGREFARLVKGVG